LGGIVPQRTQDAFNWYSKASEQNSIQAHEWLGMVYMYNSSVNYVDPNSQLGEAMVPYKEATLPSDSEVILLALMHLKITAELGKPEPLIDYMSHHVSPDQLSKSEKMVADWFAKHPKNNANP
jgi:TPR repeat protein